MDIFTHWLLKMSSVMFFLPDICLNVRRCNLLAKVNLLHLLYKYPYVNVSEGYIDVRAKVVLTWITINNHYEVRSITTNCDIKLCKVCYRTQQNGTSMPRAILPPYTMDQNIFVTLKSAVS